MRLFVDDEQIIEELLSEMPEIHPQFRLWAGALLKHRNGIKILESILTGVIKINLANNHKEALEYLNKLSSQYSMRGFQITCSDLSGKTHNRQFKKIEKINNLALTTEDDPTRFYGIVSHQVAYDLLTGRIPNFESAQKLIGADKIRTKSGNINLFEKKQSELQRPLFDKNEIFANAEFINEISKTNKISDKLLSDLREIREKIVTIMKNSSAWTDVIINIGSGLNDLIIRLSPIFTSHIDKLLIRNESYAQYLLALTLLSWLSILELSEEGERVLFREIPVLSKSLGINGGRIDAIELVSINGQKPSLWQSEVLKNMSNSRFDSVGKLMHALERKFGSKLEYKIIDWKFCVGDGIQKNSILTIDDITTPPVKHIDQIQRYITLTNLDYYLYRNNNIGDIDTIWAADKTPVKSGQLIYFSTLEYPVIHEIRMTKSEQEACFRKNIVQKLHSGKHFAKIRELNNLLVGHVVSHLSKKSANPKPIAMSQHQLNLPIDPTTKPMESIIDQHREYIDSNKIIEIGPRNRFNESINLLHLDRLEKNLIAGKIQGKFNAEQGIGFINCLMPSHEERTPSMRIDTNRGIWKCFGCGAYGFFAENSAPIELKTNINFIKKVPAEFRKTKELAIPDQHHQIMDLAQKILNQQINNPMATNYLINRAIDPQLAKSLGAGYANNKLIELLLESYSYDELIWYGFISISNKITPERGICSLFLKRGLKLAEIQRQTNTQIGLPYSVLANRLTFPLTLENRSTNFYGRAIWECTSRTKHRKLSTQNTGVQQGAFNIDILTSNYPEIILTEGVFDALSLIQMGHPATLAIIGVSNSITLESISRSEKNIAIALDHDKNETGQNNTQKIIAKLKTLNYKPTIRNFTEEFIKNNDLFMQLGCKDFNEWLISQTKTAP